MRRVIIESPFAGDLAKNHTYLGMAVRHSLSLGESPYASHGFFTNFLDDTNPEERNLGILAGLEWSNVADAVFYYLDLGMSPGMLFALERHAKAGSLIDARLLAKQEFFEFKYKNWQGQESQRRAFVRRFYWGATEYHPEPQVLMLGRCLDRGEERAFAVRDMIFTPTGLL